MGSVNVGWEDFLYDAIAPHRALARITCACTSENERLESYDVACVLDALNCRLESRISSLLAKVEERVGKLEVAYVPKEPAVLGVALEAPRRATGKPRPAEVQGPIHGAGLERASVLPSKASNF